EGRHDTARRRHHDFHADAADREAPAGPLVFDEALALGLDDDVRTETLRVEPTGRCEFREVPRRAGGHNVKRAAVTEVADRAHELPVVADLLAVFDTRRPGRIDSVLEIAHPDLVERRIRRRR